ncbi:MAG: ABC transporter substrate-binding protein [Bacillota bacterium]
MRVFKGVLAVLLFAMLIAGVASTGLAGQGKLYEMAIFEDPTTLNLFGAVGPQATVWNDFVSSSQYNVSLYGSAPPTLAFVPVVAQDMPGELKEEKIGGKTFYTSIVKMRKEFRWSDNTPLTADDVVFSYNAVLDMDPNKLGGNWPSIVDPTVLERVEKIDDYTVKFILKDKPGLAQWQYGLLQHYIVNKKYWEPVFAGAKKAADPVKELLAHDPKTEPTAGPWKFGHWEKGAFWQNVPNPAYAGKGDTTTFYENGAVTIENPKTGFKWQSGDPKGEVLVKIVEGPYATGTLYRIFQNQSAAVLSLTGGQVDFVLNSLGLQRGFQEQLKKAPNVATIENNVNGFRFMAFNLRKYPFNIKEFRQAVSILIDREYICNKVLQGIAFPQYSVVPPGNAFWFNSEVPALGRGLKRAEKITKAMELLKNAGFKWEVEPKVDLEKDKLLQRGKGLIMPDGKKMPEFEFMIMTAGYDPLRYTFGLNIAQWMKDVGIPCEAAPTEFNVIATRVFDEQNFDAFMMGWSLTVYPDHLKAFFHSSEAGLGGFNCEGYSNPEFDKLADDFIKESDLEKARQKAFKLQDILADELPYIVLFDTPIIEAYRSDRVEYPYTKVLSGFQRYGALSSVVKMLQ